MLEQIPALFKDTKQNMEFLLFAVLMNMRPKRADFGNVKILTKHPVDKTKYNYIVINAESQFVLNIHKTSFSHNQIVDDLKKYINLSLQYFPRQYLFIDSYGKQYINNHSYAEFFRRTFLKYFGKSVGVSPWRRIHNYEKLDYNTMSWKQLEYKANLMGTSVPQQFLVYKIKKDTKIQIDQ